MRLGAASHHRPRSASAVPGQTRPYNVGMSRAGRPDCWSSTSTRPTLPTRTTWRRTSGRNSAIAGGADVLAALAERAAVPFPSTYTVRTPSGGRHLYFLAPTGPASCLCATPAANAASGLGWLVDTRAHGGYVVAAGSTRRRPSPTPSRDARELAPLPAWLLQRLFPAAAPGLTARADHSPARTARPVRARGRERLKQGGCSTRLPGSATPASTSPRSRSDSSSPAARSPNTHARTALLSAASPTCRARRLQPAPSRPNDHFRSARRRPPTPPTRRSRMNTTTPPAPHPTAQENVPQNATRGLLNASAPPQAGHPAHGSETGLVCGHYSTSATTGAPWTALSCWTGCTPR